LKITDPNINPDIIVQKYCYAPPGQANKSKNCVTGFYLKKRDTNINERDQPNLLADFNRYIANTKKDMKFQSVPVKEFSVSLDNPLVPIDTGYTCIDYGYDCFYDNRDTVYTVSLPIESIRAPKGIYVFGVNHFKTKKALYTNVNLYDYSNFNPFYDYLVSTNENFYHLFIPYEQYQNYQKIMIAERAYLQSSISSSFDTLIYPKVFIVL
jgi:hypothetical protein